MIPFLVALALAAPPPAMDPIPPDDPAADLAAMQQVYEQSCAAREYGAYDDMCDQLNTQIKLAQAKAEREAREAARKPKPALKAPEPPPAPTPPTPPTPG